MRKIQKLLANPLAVKLAAGGTTLMFAHVVGGSKYICPLCGNQGIHPWEWSGSISL